MTDSSESNETPVPEPAAGPQDTFDFSSLTQNLLSFLKDPKSVWETVQSVAKEPAGFFSEGKDGDINRALGFFGCILAYGLVFALLGMLFQLQILGFFLVIPMYALFSLVALALATVVIWVLGTVVGKGEGTIMDGAKVASFLWWIGLINGFPLFVFLPALLKALISVGCLALWAYLAIPAITEKFKVAEGKIKIPVWAIAGVLALITLVSGAIGTGGKMAAESYGDVIANAEREAKKMEAAYLEQLKAEAEAEAEKPVEKVEAAVAETVNPEKAVRQILKELKALGSVEVPREYHQAFRKFNGHLQNADFSGLKVIGLDLRMLDLTGANFKNAEMTDWTFHGIGNTPSSVLDGADFTGARMQNVNMTGVSAREATFRNVTLVGTGRAKTVLDLEDANLEGADMRSMKFEGDVNAKAIYCGKAILTGADLRDSVLPNSDFTRARMRQANLEGADLRGAVLNVADIREAVFEDANLVGMQISDQLQLDNQFIPFDSPMAMTEGANFSGAKLDGVNFQYRNFRFCDFSGASLVNANLEAGNFVGSNFAGADLSGATLKRANFAAVNFKGTRFHQNDWENTHLAGASIKPITTETAVMLPPLPEGSEIPRLGSGKASDKVQSMVDGSAKSWVGADLRKISFERQRLTQLDFTGADLQGAVFNFAELGRCNFSRANLNGASFAFARLNQCNFDEAQLEEASFYGAVLSAGSFVKANLKEADFRYVGRAEFAPSSKLNFEGADMRKADFRMARLAFLLRYGHSNNTGNSLPMGVGLGGSSSYLDFDYADLRGADLRGAWLIEVSLARTDIRGIDARDADLSGFYANWDTQWEGADLRNANLAFGQIWHLDVERVQDGKSDFAKADVRGSNLFRIAFTPGTYIGAADFSNCVFAVDPWGKITDIKNGASGTDLAMVNFAGANFEGADLRRCGFANTNLKGARFTNADLSYASFGVGNGVQAGRNLEANLEDWSLRYRDISFKGARLDHVNLDSGDFSGSDFSVASHTGIKVHRDSRNAAPEGISYMNYAYFVPDSLK